MVIRKESSNFGRDNNNEYYKALVIHNETQQRKSAATAPPRPARNIATKKADLDAAVGCNGSVTPLVPDMRWCFWSPDIKSGPNLVL